jgi:hypothetical protein
MSPELPESEIRRLVRKRLREGTLLAATTAVPAATAARGVVSAWWAAMDDLASRQPFSHGPCACAATGLCYGWSPTGPRG